MCKGGFERGPQTFQRREEVVAVGRPIGESNPVASGRSGGEIPIMGLSDQAARFSRKAPSAKEGKVGSMRAGMVHGTYELRSRLKVGMGAGLLTCSKS